MRVAWFHVFGKSITASGGRELFWGILFWPLPVFLFEIPLWTHLQPPTSFSQASSPQISRSPQITPPRGLSPRHMSVFGDTSCPNTNTVLPKTSLLRHRFLTLLRKNYLRFPSMLLIYPQLFHTLPLISHPLLPKTLSLLTYQFFWNSFNALSSPCGLSRLILAAVTSSVALFSFSSGDPENGSAVSAALSLWLVLGQLAQLWPITTKVTYT